MTNQSPKMNALTFLMSGWISIIDNIYGVLTMNAHHMYCTFSVILWERIHTQLCQFVWHRKRCCTTEQVINLVKVIWLISDGLNVWSMQLVHFLTALLWVPFSLSFVSNLLDLVTSCISIDKLKQLSRVFCPGFLIIHAKLLSLLLRLSHLPHGKWSRSPFFKIWASRSKS
jgi:hypothetical protein